MFWYLKLRIACSDKFTIFGESIKWYDRSFPGQDYKHPRVSLHVNCITQQTILEKKTTFVVLRLSKQWHIKRDVDAVCLSVSRR